MAEEDLREPLVDRDVLGPLIGDQRLAAATAEDETKHFLWYTKKEWDELRLWWSYVWPTICLFFCSSSMTLIDLSFVGHLSDGNNTSTDYMAAFSLAGILFEVSNALFIKCFIQVLAVLCSQAYGSGNEKLMGRWLQLCIVIMFIVGIPTSVVYWYAGEILNNTIGLEKKLLPLVNEFSRWSILRLYPMLVSGALQQFCLSQKVIKPLVAISGLSVVMNIVFNQVLIAIFGFRGSPMATALTNVIISILTVYYVFYWRKDIKKRTWTPWSMEVFNKKRFKEYMSQAIPLTVAICMEAFQIQSVGLLVVHLSNTKGDIHIVSTHNGLISFFGTICAFQGGVLRGTSIRAATYIGAQDVKGAKRVVRLATSVSSVIGGTMSMVIFFGRYTWPKLYSDDPEIWSQSVGPLVLIAVGYFLCVVFYIAMAVLDAQGRPGVVAVGFLFGAWVTALPLIYLFGFKLKMDLLGIWIGLLCGYVVTAIILLINCIRTDWDKVLEDSRRRNALGDVNSLPRRDSVVSTLTSTLESLSGSPVWSIAG